jgi:hypothetical protein
MKTWGSGGIAPPFLISAPDGGEWSATRSDRFTPGERAPGTHWIGGWLGPRAGLDAVEKIKILPLSGIEPRPSSPSLYRLLSFGITFWKASHNITAVWDVTPCSLGSTCCFHLQGILKMEAVGSSRMFISIYETTRLRTPEDINHSHCTEQASVTASL